MEYKHTKTKKGLFKRWMSGLLAVIMLIIAFPLQAIAAQLNYDDIGGQKSTYINNVDPVTPAVLDGTKSATEYIKEPEMPEIYTLRSDYLVQKDHKWRVNYQPYVASVGANATQEEKNKVNKKINLPDLKGYEKPQDSFDITYDSIVKAAKTGEKTGDAWQKDQEFKYDAKESAFYVKHVFQSLTNFNEYGKKDGETKDHLRQVTGRTGSILDIQPLDKSFIEGFTPEADKLTSMVPENTIGFQVEYRYNRNAYEIDYDTDGGSDIDSRLLYYGQVIPKVEVPTKKGSIFLGWKPSVEIKGTVNNVEKTFAANEIIKDNADNVIKDLDAKLIVPAKNVVFKADWKDAPKADYLIQFWTEKPDYDDKHGTLPLRERYDYIGSRRIEDADTGSRPNLTNLSIKGITFPDLNDGRLEKAQNDPKEFARYYFLNKDLTEKQNASKKDPTVQKSVLSTGETVYNVYYDRRVYTLYFTSINNEHDDYAYWPIITKDGQELGKEGAPYKVDVRFNQSLDKIWPKDEEISGLPKGDSTEPTGDDGLIGWMINHNNNDNGVSIFRDTPPYRLSAEDFIDAKDVMSTEDESGGKGHADKIPIGENETKDRGEYEISLGASYIDTAIAYHIDIIKDDFEGKEQIDYDMSYWKSDTNTYDYEFILPHLQGFTLKQETRPAQLIGKIKVGDVEKTFDELNEERNAITPFRSDDDKIEYISHFPWSKKLFDGTNAYDYANYTRNKYKLKLNNDPKAIKNDNEYVLNKDMFDVYYEMPLNDLNLDTNNVPKKPDWVPDNWEFKGWATDPAGENLLKDGKETKLNYDQFLFAKWGEPDAKWKVTIDPDGGTMKNITVEDLIFRRSEDHNVNKSAVKEANDGNKQIFTVNHKEKLNKVQKPKRKGYDFLGWQVIRHNKNGSVDTSYRKTYGVPELYAFGNEVVGEVYIKAIWLANNKIDVPVYHHFIDKDGNEIIKPRKFVIEDARAKYYTAATATEQNQDWILMPHEELMDLPDENKVKQDYIKYNEHHKFDNTDIHSIKVEPQFILGEDGNSKSNPKAEFNEFHFYYRRFKTRDYKVNYLDKKAQAEIKKIIEGTDTVDAKKAAIKKIVEANSIIPQEEVVSRNRHYDARNYRRIPGWKLASDPQQQLFYNVEEDTGEFKGINGTGLDEIFFYYEDVRVIDVPKDDPVPEGYVRITFKADKGGAFTDKDGNSKTELYYDVIKGLKSDLLVVPQELKEGADKEDGKYYITPDNGKTFTKWDDKPLLNDNTIIENTTKNYYVFTAKFDWSGVSAKGIVTTEAFKDPNGKWTNDFAPTIDKLKGQIEWREKDQVKQLPADATVKIVDENDKTKELTDADVYEKVKEFGKPDKDEIVRTINFKAIITFKDGKNTKELDIPVKVYKNVYEALNKEGDKPLFLKEAEEKEAKDGGLKEILKDNKENRYIKVTIKPNKDFTNKDDKVYYVNPNAWVEIPEVKTDGDTRFTKWTADKDAQNENGKFDFTKRHKFTEDTVITPQGAKDVVEQTDPNTKPDVPETYVKVIVDKTTNAELGADEKQTQTFWVNPTKEVIIPVTNPMGKTNQEVDIPNLGKKNVNYVFKEWQKVKTGEADDSLADVNPVEKIELTSHKYTDKVTVIEAAYKKSIQAGKIEEPIKTKKLDTPQGKEITKDDLIKQITPQAGKEIASIEVISKPDGNTVGNEPAKVIVKYKDGTTQGTNDNPVVIPVEVHKNIIPAGPNGEKPEKALENYVKVIFKAGTGGKFENTLTNQFVYYVSPEVEVDLTNTAGNIKKIPNVGYYVNGEQWDNKDNKTLKGTFTDAETEFVFKFTKSDNIITKVDENTKKPDGYVTVTFKTDGHGKVDGKDIIIYYVDPNAGITLKVLGEGETATDKQLAVPKATANPNYTFNNVWQEPIDEATQITSDRTHVAIFQDGKVKLTYLAGDGATGTVPAETEVKIGTKVRLANADGLSKANATFAGWKIGNETYKVGQEITLNENTTAIAQWSAAKHTVKFIFADGAQFTQEEVEHGKTATKPTTDPTLDGKVFMGWKENESDENYFNFSTPITEDKTLIAIWQDPVQNINDGDTVEDQFIKVTFKQGDHGKLKIGEVEQTEPVIYKVDKKLTFDAAKEKGMNLPDIVPAKYYKVKTNNAGWDKGLNLTLQNGETEKVFTAQYEPMADVIPVDPTVTDETQIQNEKPDGMVLVVFKVDEKKAYMLGDTKFYVKKDEVVNIPKPLVRRLELDNGVQNDYVFKGWDLTALNNEWKFSDDTTIDDGTKVKPTITIILPSAGDSDVIVDSMTEGATAYLEVTRSNKTTKIKAEYDNSYGMYFFEIPDNLGGALNKRDRIKVYAELKGVISDTREYRIK